MEDAYIFVLSVVDPVHNTDENNGYITYNDVYPCYSFPCR